MNLFALVKLVIDAKFDDLLSRAKSLREVIHQSGCFDDVKPYLLLSIGVSRPTPKSKPPKSVPAPKPKPGA